MLLSMQWFKDLYLTATQNTKLLAPKASLSSCKGGFREVTICKASAEYSGSSALRMLNRFGVAQAWASPRTPHSPGHKTYPAAANTLPGALDRGQAWGS